MSLTVPSSAPSSHGIPYPMVASNAARRVRPRGHLPGSCRFAMTSVRSGHGPAVSAVAVGRASLLDLVGLLLGSQPAAGDP